MMPACIDLIFVFGSIPRVQLVILGVLRHLVLLSALVCCVSLLLGRVRSHRVRWRVCRVPLSARHSDWVLEVVGSCSGASPKVTARGPHEENPIAASRSDPQAGDVLHVGVSQLLRSGLREDDDLLRVGGSDELIPDTQPQTVPISAGPALCDVVCNVPTSTVPGDRHARLRRGVGATTWPRCSAPQCDQKRDHQDDGGSDELHPPRQSPEHDQSARVGDNKQRREGADVPGRPTTNRPHEGLDRLRCSLARHAVDGRRRRRASPPHSTLRCLPITRLCAWHIRTAIRLDVCAQHGALRRGRRWLATSRIGSRSRPESSRRPRGVAR